MLSLVITLLIIALIAGILKFGGREDRVSRRVGNICHLIADDRLPRRVRAPAMTICSDSRRVRGSPCALFAPAED